MGKQSFHLKGSWIEEHLIRRGLSRKELAAQVGCAERYLRMILNEGRPVSYDILTRFCRVLGIAKEELLEIPDERAALRGNDNSATVNQFFAAMFSGLPDDALRVFAPGAKVKMHVRAPEILALFGTNARRAGIFEGRESISQLLQSICQLARVKNARDVTRTPCSDDRLLIEGWVEQEFPSQPPMSVTYDYALVFLFKDGQIQELDIYFDTHKVSEALKA